MIHAVISAGKIGHNKALNRRELNMKRQNGFTLIEIAIVLVIIGLLLGGVLKGQEMITQAKIRNVANDFNGSSAAYYAYQDRYRAIPGDDRNATRWASATAALPAGTVGNGFVEGTYNSTTATDESRVFWQHLRFSGLVAGATSDTLQPQNAVGGITGVQNNALGLAGLVVCSSNLPGKVAGAIDAQFDDGNAQTGQVRGLAAAANGNAPTTAPTANYVDDGSTIYVVCKNI